VVGSAILAVPTVRIPLALEGLIAAFAWADGAINRVPVLPAAITHVAGIEGVAIFGVAADIGAVARAGLGSGCGHIRELGAAVATGPIPNAVVELRALSTHCARVVGGTVLAFATMRIPLAVEGLVTAVRRAVSVVKGVAPLETAVALEARVEGVTVQSVIAHLVARARHTPLSGLHLLLGGGGGGLWGTGGGGDLGELTALISARPPPDCQCCRIFASSTGSTCVVLLAVSSSFTVGIPLALQ